LGRRGRRLVGAPRTQLGSDHFKRGFGKKNNVIIPDLGWAKEPADVEALAHEKEEIYRSLVREKGIEPLPGVRELLAALRAENIPCAIASSTERANLDLPIDLMGLREFFTVIVSGEEVVHGKPDPAVFLLAAERLGIKPADCFVIEDALVGIEAAKRAGMPVLAVATTNSIETLSSADAAVSGLMDLNPDRLAVLAAAQKN
jgi:HAD superfamily hydrolase (TIGR01509 family)